MGLLDITPDQTDMMMNLSQGLLASSAPSRLPVGFGQVMLGGVQGMQQGAQQRRANQMQDMQLQQGNMQLQQERMRMEAARKSMADEETAKANLSQYLQAMPDGPQKQQVVQAVQMGVPLSKVWEKLNPELKAPEGMKYGAGGALEEIPGYVSMKSRIAAAGRNPAPATPYYSPVQTAQGVMAFNARTGRMEPVQVGGQNVVGAQADPALQGSIASAKEFGKTTAEDKAKGITDAPRVIANAEEALRLADELLKHPGFTQAVGTSSMLGVQKIPGTNAKDFMNRLDQIKGGAFLEAFNTLKGGGQITEVEGKKATDAIARMDNATSEAEFKNAVRDYQNVIRNGMNRAKMRAGGNLPAPVASPTLGGAKFLGFE